MGCDTGSDGVGDVNCGRSSYFGRSRRWLTWHSDYVIEMLGVRTLSGRRES